MSIDHPYRVIPFATLSPSACKYIADRGRTALAVLGTWRVGRGLRHRLHEAVEHLDAVANRGSFGEASNDLEATAEALNLCIDFFQISGSLTEDPIAHIAAELATSIQGSLSGTAARRQPLEFQSQYWFGMLLTASGMPAFVPKPGSTKTPDFLVDVDSLEIAVEVKRPQTFHSAPDAMDRAAGQIRTSGRPGLIAIDLSDCLGANSLRVGALDSPVRIEDLVRPVFVARSKALSRRALTYTRSDKYQRVLGVALYARISGWRRANLSQPESVFFLEFPVFPTAAAGLIVNYSERLKTRILKGLESLTGSPPRPIAGAS